MSSLPRQYEHRVDKALIPTCNIMGVDIAAINIDWLLEFTDKYIHSLSGDYMCVSNVHTTVTAYEIPEYRTIQNSGDLKRWNAQPVLPIWKKFSEFQRKKDTGIFFMALRRRPLKKYTVN